MFFIIFVILLSVPIQAIFDNNYILAALTDLSENPSELLEEISYIKQRYGRKIRDLGTRRLTCKNSKKLIQKYEKKCPLFLLSECGTNNNQPCALSRTVNRKARDQFEKAMRLNLLSVLLVRQPRYCTYTSFASGQLFQDLRIIAQALNFAHDSKLIIHLIDRQYDCYARACRINCYDREIRIDRNLDTRLLTDIFYPHALFELLEWEARFKQFLKILYNLFPMADILVYVHEHVESYFAYCQQHYLAYPDIISAIDIGPHEEHDARAISDFAWLYAQAAFKNEAVRFSLMCLHDGEIMLNFKNKFSKI